MVQLVSIYIINLLFLLIKLENDMIKILTVHSGPHPVMVSGFGTSFPRQRQIGFPNLLAMHIVPGPQGDGLHGSGFSMHLKHYFHHNITKY